MKAIVSSTYDDKYLYFLPIVTWCWNKLGVEVICFLPYLKDGIDGYNPDKEKREKYGLIIDTLDGLGVELQAAPFLAPEHKEATYAQCSRLYAACLDLPEDEILITSDVDMAVFNQFKNKIDTVIKEWGGSMGTAGYDLVPDGQYPICYAWGAKRHWERVFDLKGVSYQVALDNLLGNIECDNMRGNYWGKDQEELFKGLNKYGSLLKIPRTNGGNQFATLRVDRDDANWRSYVNEKLVDAHLWRPGYTDENFANIMELLTMKYPDENFKWLIDYTSEYKKLL